MQIPEGAFGLLVLILLSLPGVVWAAARARLVGFSRHDRDVASRILQAVTVSAILDAAYVLVLGDWLVQLLRDVYAGQLQSPRTAAAVLLVLGGALPALLAFVGYTYRLKRRPGSSGWRRWQLVHLRKGRSASPTAWDHAAPGLGGTYVRVRMPSGQWVGGWFGNRSHISTYPEPRDLYIEHQCDMQTDGSFGPLRADGAGTWIPLSSDDLIVEWVDPTRVQGAGIQGTAQTGAKVGP